MNNPKVVHRLVPDIYSNNETMLAIYDAQADELGQYEDKIYQIFLNNLVKFCDIEGIRRFEAIFNIQADEENETLEFRRSRIIIKFTLSIPYTKISLKNMLSEVYGANNVDIDIEYNNYSIKIALETSIVGLVEQTTKELRQEIIPANMGITVIDYEPYMHRYLNKHYTYDEMRRNKKLTYGELSKYATF